MTEDVPDHLDPSEEEIHEHLAARMAQRGVTSDEIRRVLQDGWQAADAKPGTLGRAFVFSFGREWEGRHYEEKEVTVYFKVVASRVVLLTAKARYGKNFPKEPME